MKLIALLIASALAMPVFAAEEKKPAPETKTVCVDIKDKNGKDVIDPKTKKVKQDCKKVKVHKKHEGTKVEDAKKK
jgi:azurin